MTSPGAHVVLGRKLSYILIAWEMICTVAAYIHTAFMGRKVFVQVSLYYY